MKEGMQTQQTSAEIGTTINWDFYNLMLENNDFTDNKKWDLNKVCQFIYQATYVRYAQKFQQEYDYARKLEKTVVDKCTIIDRQIERLAELEAKVREYESRDEVQEQGNEATKSNT